MSKHPQVLLRAMEPEDLDLLYKVENDQALWGLGTTNVPYSRYTLHDYIANASGDIYTDKQVRLMVESVEGSIVGIADIVNFDAKNQRAEVGLVIMNKYRQKGFGSSTLNAIADYALRVLHLHQLYVYIDIQNLSSIALFRKMGYQVSTELADWLFDGKEYHNAVLMQTIF